MKTVIAILAVIGLAAGGAVYYVTRVVAEAPVVFRVAPIKRGDLLVTIGATGTIEPEEVIDIGAQVAGRIISFGPDPDRPGKTVDFCSVVHPGMLLANIDQTYYKAQVDQAEAAYQRAKADLVQLQAKLEQAEQEWKRAERLRPQRAIADTDYDLAVSNYHVAQANIAVGQAAIRQADAALEMAKANLAYTVIKSPVEGEVIARRVNVGQTVVGSMNAASMFLIAKDLRRMQVWASVNEADIGRIRVGLPARFTVDAFPGETFHGEVTQVRMNAQMTQNVVLYTVVVTTDNSNRKLLPYLTANVKFEIEQRTNVFLAPNAALRWKPQSASLILSNGIEAVAATPATEKPAGPRDEVRRLWIAEGNLVRPLDVTLGPSDGTMTEIRGHGVKEGLRLVVGEGAEAVDEVAEGTTNPFLPKFPGKKKATPPPQGSH